MKQAIRFIVVAAVAVSISALVSTALAETGHLGSSGARSSFQGVRYHGGSGGGGWHGGGWGGWHGGYYGRGWGWGGWWYPYWGVSLAYSPYYYPYYYNGYYYSYPPATYYPPPATYSSQATVDYNSSSYMSPAPPAAVSGSPPPQSVDRPLSPTAVDRDTDSTPPPPPRDQRPPQLQRGEPGQSVSVADVKALVKAGLSDDVILSHIRNSQVVYHLTTAEIIDLKNAGVSEKVIDYMINTASGQR